MLDGPVIPTELALGSQLLMSAIHDFNIVAYNEKKARTVTKTPATAYTSSAFCKLLPRKLEYDDRLKAKTSTFKPPKNSTRLFAAAMLASKSSGYFSKPRRLLQMGRHDEKYLVGAITFLCSNKYDYIDVITTKGYRGLASSDDKCTIRVVKPSDLEQESTDSEAGDPVVYGQSFGVGRPRLQAT